MQADQFMQEAFRLALSADPSKVRPNPLVGAVLVSQEGNIIGKGFHQQAGKEHAEVLAIQDALKNFSDLSQTTLYVTLEPCSHHGKTPPCTDLIIQHRIKTVIIGSMDVNPKVNGVQTLRDAGINVEFQIDEALKKMNKVFYKNIEEKRPFITLKTAVSLDGKIADSFGNSKWISNEKSRQYVHDCLRINADAIFTTYETVIRDNASLNIRFSDGSIKDKHVIVLDRQLKLLDQTNNELKIFKSHPASNIYLICEERSIYPTRAGVVLIPTVFNEHGVTNIYSVLCEIYKKGFFCLLVEAGTGLSTSLLDANCIDEIVLCLAPFVMGGKDSKSIFQSHSINRLVDKKIFGLECLQRFDDDIVITYLKK